MATSVVEDYLKCILAEQQRSAELVSMGHIGVVLKVAPGTVTAMIKTLAESGLVAYEPYSGVRLTDAGLKLATHVQRRHRLLELFLVEIVGLDWSEVHDEAERLEHAVSERLIERIDLLLGHPSADPHGDPIPDRLGRSVESSSASLLVCPLQSDVRVVRVADQSPGFLQLLERRGLSVGSRLQVAERSEVGDSVELTIPDRAAFTLGFKAAAKVYVDEL